jgi:hypothetical protein
MAKRSEKAGTATTKAVCVPGKNEMATERQIIANRANAKQSTGPKTDRGRRTSSQNALRHGLAASARSQQPAPITMDDLVDAISCPEADEMRAIAALETARAQAELLRVRCAKATLLAAMDPNGDVGVLRQLLALGRYEKAALGKRRVAAKAL